MIRVGLTGNVAAGKSVVARVWSEVGVPVLSSDELAREVVRPGGPALREIQEAFGDEVLAPDGTLDRARMRDRVFRDPEGRKRLEAITHPRITELRRRWLSERRREGEPLVATEVPLLFEAGLEGEFDVVVVVDAPAELRKRRLVEGRGMNAAEARRIMSSQGDPAEKRRRADHVLDNRGTIPELEEKASALLDHLRATAGATGE